MGNCLQSKLKEIVNNDNLVRIGEGKIVLTTSNSSTYKVNFSTTTQLTLTGDRKFTNNNSNKITLSTATNLTIGSGQSGDLLKIFKMDNLTVFKYFDGDVIPLNTEVFKYCTHLTDIAGAANNVKGSLANLYNSAATLRQCSFSGGSNCIVPTEEGLEGFFEAGWSAGRRSLNFTSDYCGTQCFFAGYDDDTLFSSQRKIVATYSDSNVVVNVINKTSNTTILTATYNGSTWSYVSA